MTDPRVNEADVRYFLTPANMTPAKGCSDEVVTATLQYGLDGELHQVVVRRGQTSTWLTPAEVEVLAELVRTRAVIK